MSICKECNCEITTSMTRHIDEKGREHYFCSISCLDKYAQYNDKFN